MEDLNLFIESLDLMREPEKYIKGTILYNQNKENLDLVFEIFHKSTPPVQIWSMFYNHTDKLVALYKKGNIQIGLKYDQYLNQLHYGHVNKEQKLEGFGILIGSAGFYWGYWQDQELIGECRLILRDSYYIGLFE